MTKTTIEETAAVAAAAANVAALETEQREAQRGAEQAQAYAAALPGRLAAGDQAVTTDDLVQAGPTAAVAAAKATAVGRVLAGARVQLENARATELVARLRCGKPFLEQGQVDKELDRIAAYVLRELGKLGARIEEHNEAFAAVVVSLPRGAGHVFPAGGDGDRLGVHHNYNGRVIELDGAEWWAISKHGMSRDIAGKVEMAEAIARDAERLVVWGEILDSERGTATAV